jgi:hypothetical protein
MTVLKDIDFRPAIMLGVNAFLFVLVSFLNDSLAHVSIYVFALSVFIVPAALFLKFWQMIVCLVITGFFLELAQPITRGITPAIMMLSGIGVFYIREKFRNLDPMGVFTLFWVVNALLFVFACVFLYPKGILNFGAYVTRILVDFVCSSLVIFLFSNFLLKVYRSVFYLCGFNLEIPEDA